jgi:hypothetical protein
LRVERRRESDLGVSIVIGWFRGSPAEKYTYAETDDIGSQKEARLLMATYDGADSGDRKMVGCSLWERAKMTLH